ncbi:MAG: RNA polymerase sigma factor [Acidimicrobiia bacterium]
MDDAKVYQELRYELTRLATALVGPTEAEDVVSTVVARVLERPGGLIGLREPRPYLVKAVLNEGRSRLRRQRRWGLLPLGQSTHPTFTHGHDDLVDLVMRLPLQQRAATFLVYWEGHSPTSAAELMGCRPATVRRYLHLARKKLEEAVGE